MTPGPLRADRGGRASPDASAARRTVVLAADPLTVARELLPGRRLVAPNARAARAVRGGPAASRGLQERAVTAARSQGASLAGAVSRLVALRDAVTEVLAPADVEGTARRVQPVVSEMLRAGVASRPWLVSALEAAEGVGRRSVDVVRLALAYSRRLQERGEVDPAEVLWRAAASPPAPEPLLVSGYARLGEGEVAFLDAVAAAGSAVVLPRAFAASEAAAALLASRGWSVVEDERVGEAPGPRLAARFTAAVGEDGARAAAPYPAAPPALTAVRLPNEEEEVRFVLARVKALLAAGVQPDRVVLVARDERGYGPLVKAVAAEFGVPVRLAYALSLRETRFGDALSLLIEAVGGGLPFEPTAKLLRHPLTRALPDASWATARARHASGAEEWLAAGVEAAEALAWPERATWAEHRERFSAALAALGLAAPGHQRDARARRLLEGALRDALPSEGSPAAGEVVTRVRFLGLLGDVLDVTVMPADPPRRDAVELHTPLAVFGARYDHVLVVGLSEGVFPEDVSDDPVVDFHERRAVAAAGLELEDARGAAEREELSFLAVLHACGVSLTLTCPETFGGKERLPSSFFAAVGADDPVPAGPRAPASALERLIATLPAVAGRALDAPLTAARARDAWSVEMRREGGDPPDAFDGVHGVPLPAAGPCSATQLTTFGQCSFRWFLQYDLSLRELVEAEEDVSPVTIGWVYHQALALATLRAKEEAPVCGETPEDDPFRAAVVDHLERAYDDAHVEMEERGTRVRSLTWPLQRRENLATLRRLVMSPVFALPGARVESVERRFKAVWRGLEVVGVVDRIDVVDVGGEERLVLTDYKLGASAPRGAKGGNGRLNLDVQLPLYVEAAAPVLHPGVPVATARYLSITAAEVTKEVGPDGVDAAALDDLVARFRRALTEGSFPLDPDEAFEACRYCEFDIVCRKGPRLSRKGGPAEEVVA
ncbi:MAG TPA: PD-(D/E)XK nuclease family protein [Trueperaceae bacterium]|nr:PD-(D/E)XK nuclease family protein [Trueperaceae bacterium]